MSSEERDMFKEVDIGLVADCAKEPSYLSEIARKLQKLNLPLGYTKNQLRELETFDRTWDSITENHSVRLVSFIVNTIMEDGSMYNDVDNSLVSYDTQEDGGRGTSQYVGSVHTAMGPDGGVTQKEWRDYKLVYNDSGGPIGSYYDNAGLQEFSRKLKDSIDTSVRPEEKIDIIEEVSRKGNTMSYNAERIVEDVLERQFRYYEKVGSTSYNNPGPDFWVYDENNREHGLVVEVSSRYVNPIGDEYISNKVDTILSMEEKDEVKDIPFDLLIIAPSFTNRAEKRYEFDRGDDRHDDFLSDMVHLHKVPHPEQTIYRHYLGQDVDDGREVTGGNPVVVRDDDNVLDRLENSAYVGENYPVSSGDFKEFSDTLDYVNRDYDIISESHYRNMVRESLEPLLWEFMRPYKIEQFLVDMYWKEGLTQGEIGRLVDVNEGTIGDWMKGGIGSDRWDVVRRGTGAPNISTDTIEVWKAMYRGESPFPKEFSVYRILAEYNRFPMWGIDEWSDWYGDTTPEERKEFMSTQDSYSESLSYTVMVGAGEKFFQPSYGFVLKTLKEEGVEIRPPDSAPRVPYSAYSNKKTIGWMINRDTGIVAKDAEGRDLVKQEDVEVFDSYLEVDIATWFSENDIAHAHEPFTIPSVLGPEREQWERMVTAVRAVGKSASNRSEAMEMYSSVKSEINEEEASGRIDEMIAQFNFDEFVGRVLPIWNAIYDKHRLAEEFEVPEVLGSLEFFDKRYVIPDIVVYKGEDKTERGKDWSGWDNWSHIVEVSGLWGVNIPDDSVDDKWWEWYRVSGVAYKELAYKLLGLWEDDDGNPRVIYTVPYQPDIDGSTDGIPEGLYDDDNYLIFKSNQMGIGIEKLQEKLGVLADSIESGLSPPIELIKHKRGQNQSEFTRIEYEHSGINESMLGENGNVTPVGDGMIVYWGDIGEVFIDESNVYVKESFYNRRNLIMLRDYALDVVSQLSDDGIIDTVTRVGEV